jgi:hypothetical protein
MVNGSTTPPAADIGAAPIFRPIDKARTVWPRGLPIDPLQPSSLNEHLTFLRD